MIIKILFIRITISKSIASFRSLNTNIHNRSTYIYRQINPFIVFFWLEEGEEEESKSRKYIICLVIFFQINNQKTSNIYSACLQETDRLCPDMYTLC